MRSYVPERNIARNRNCTNWAEATPVPDRYTLGMKVRLKQIREERGLTQEQLAEMVCTTHATIQRYESGKRQIPSSKVFRLAAALKCHPGEIFAPLPSAGGAPGRAADIAAHLGDRDVESWIE